MLGAVAAGKGSQVRAWFVARLRRAVLALRSRGWIRPLEILEKCFVSDVGLVARFRALWQELDSEGTPELECWRYSELSCRFQGGRESVRGLLGSKPCTAIVFIR